MLCRYSGAKELTLDLSLLLPLWKLKEKMLGSYSDASVIVPSVVRALTELFLVAESVAKVSDQHL